MILTSGRATNTHGNKRKNGKRTLRDRKEAGGEQRRRDRSTLGAKKCEPNGERGRKDARQQEELLQTRARSVTRDGKGLRGA